MNRFDQLIEEVSEALLVLPPRRIAIFFALVALRLLPLTNRTSLRFLFNDVWRTVTEKLRFEPELAQRVEDAVPHADDEDDNLETLITQDIAILLDSALKWHVGSHASAGWVQYGLEPFKAAACLKILGVIDPGSADPDAFDAICSDKNFTRELVNMKNDIKLLSIETARDWEALRKSTLKNQWSKGDLEI